jgi:hypothetical protein
MGYNAYGATMLLFTVIDVTVDDILYFTYTAHTNTRYTTSSRQARQGLSI